MAATYMKLDQRMQRTGALPNAGGLLDQDEGLMKILDRVASLRASYAKGKAATDA